MENKTSSGLDAKVAGLLCYVAWWITGIIFLIIEKENKSVRFHAWQSIYVFGALTIAGWMFSVIPVIGWIISWLIWVLSIILWIVLMVKAYQGSMYKVPIAGELAAKMK